MKRIQYYEDRCAAITRPSPGNHDDQSSYREALNSRRLAIGAVAIEFKNDLFATHGVQNNPKREELFRLAWEYGHSAGYYDVDAYFGEMVALVK